MVDEKPSEGAGSTLPDFSAGSRIAGYRLEQRVRQGGMAVVFRAVDDRLGRQVALKVMSAELAADETFRQRFIRESRDAAAVDDPHLIPIYEAGQADGLLFIAMRYVAGGDVQSLVHRDGPLPAARAAAIISPVASALDAAHAAGLVHRDVKPANMLLDIGPGRPDHVYLADFGISRRTQSLTGLTGTGQFLGTLDYAAPEQIQGEHTDGRADQSALACTAFELLSGEPPFPREDATAVIWAQMTEPPPSLTSRRPYLPAAADTVLARALAKKPGDRYGSCREFADALRDALGLTPYAAGTPMPQASRSQPETGNPAGVSSIGHLAAAQDEQHQATRDARIPHSQSRKRDHRSVIIRPRSRARLLVAVIAGAVVVVLATLAGIHLSGDTGSPHTSSLSPSSPPPAASAPTLTRSPATIPDNMYTAVMISDSLGSAFWGSSGNLNSAETIAKDDCLRTASNNPNYQGDCTHGIWVRNGFIVAYTSGPYTNGNQPTAWGAGDNRTYKAAAPVALSECRSSGGQSCRFDSEWAPKTPIPANAVTTGGPWSINGGGT
jgi:serine/threonine protein kinase